MEMIGEESQGGRTQVWEMFVYCIVLLITLILKLPYFIMQDFCNID